FRMLLLSIPLLLYTEVSIAFEGKSLSENVVGYLGIPYAKAPVRERRFKESESVEFDVDRSYQEWLLGCPDVVSTGRNEDCLFLNLLQFKGTSRKVDTLLIFSNEKLSEVKLTGLVSSSLNVVTASVRTGLLGSFNAIPHGVSDVINVVKFLRDNADALHIGKITVWAESLVAETVASALSRTNVERAILINGNARTRTIGREGFSKRAAHKILTELQCDLPSVNQAMDCLRSKQLSELYKAADQLTKPFYPFGVPFRCPSYEQPAIPTILGVFRQLPKEYPSDSDFDEKFQYINFKRFLAGLIPDSQFQNAPLLRRQILHQYIYTQGDKKNTYFLFEQMRKILLDRDFIAPTQQLVSELKQKKSDVYLLEYGIDNPPTSCLQDGGWDDIKPFCDKMFQYFTRFATKGQPTKNSCEPTNPTWPAMGSAKRDYHVILKADGTIEWESKFHLASTQLWNNFLLALDKLELKGRRDAIFKEETQLDPHEVEDDVQEWHKKAADVGGFDFTEEHALGDMPLHMEL
uniref:COesterase domain-containing protein n=1 Tax=Haemonchus contortus TaxID=6289 RepID=A0A7I5E7W3_HAECO